MVMAIANKPRICIEVKMGIFTGETGIRAKVKKRLPPKISFSYALCI